MRIPLTSPAAPRPVIEPPVETPCPARRTVPPATLANALHHLNRAIRELQALRDVLQTTPIGGSTAAEIKT